MELYYHKLKKLRKKTGLQTKVICERIGISLSTLWHWEKGSKIPSEKKVRKLADVLQVPVEEISNLTSEVEKSEQSLTGLINSWSGGKDVHNQEKINVFKDTVNSIVRQYEQLTQYSLITNAILTSINSIIYIKDTNQKYILANNAFLDNLSLDHSLDVNGKSDSDFFPSTEAKWLYDQDKHVISTGLPLVNIDGYLPGTRRKKFALMSKFPILDSNKKIAGVVAVINDITERKKASRIREILGIYIDAMTDCLSVYNAETHRYIYVNNAYEEVFGYSVEKFYEGGLTDFFLNNCVHPDDRANEEEYLKTKHWPKRRTYRIIRPNGEIRWLEGNIVVKKYQGADCCISINRDITDRKQSGDITRVLEATLSDTGTAAWICERGETGEVLYVSKSLYFMTGYNEAEFRKSKDFWLSYILHPEDKCNILSVYNGNDGFSWNKCRFVKKDGQIIKLEIKCAIINFLGKECLCFTCKNFC